MTKIRGTNKTSRETNVWDVLKAIVDGLFNFMNLSKVAALAIFWFIVRDIIFVVNLPKGYDYAGHLLNEKFLEYIVSNDNVFIIVLIGVVLFFGFSCVSLIFYVFILKAEIKRIAKSRSRAMHAREKLKEHNTSEMVKKEEMYD